MASSVYLREYRAKNKAKILAVEKERYLRKREEIKRKSKEWYDANKERASETRCSDEGRRKRANNEMARRARKRDQFVENIDRAVVFDRDEGICGICGESADRENFHVDHIIPLSRGGEHSYQNVQVAHPRCNMRKHRGGDVHPTH